MQFFAALSLALIPGLVDSVPIPVDLTNDSITGTDPNADSKILGFGSSSIGGLGGLASGCNGLGYGYGYGTSGIGLAGGLGTTAGLGVASGLGVSSGLGGSAGLGLGATTGLGSGIGGVILATDPTATNAAATTDPTAMNLAVDA